MERATIKCPFEESECSPCMSRDGSESVTDKGVCAGCGKTPEEVLKHLDTKMHWRKLPERVYRMFGKADPAVLANILRQEVEDYLDRERYAARS